MRAADEAPVFGDPAAAVDLIGIALLVAISVLLGLVASRTVRSRLAVGSALVAWWGIDSSPAARALGPQSLPDSLATPWDRRDDPDAAEACVRTGPLPGPRRPSGW